MRAVLAFIRRKIGDVQTTGIQMIAGDQHAGFSIVIRDVCRMVSRNRKHVDHAIAQIDRANIRRPLGDSESFLVRLNRRRNHRRVRHLREPASPAT
jgi:hypothetical protein